jgi:ABC-type nitrate/sulfonate/bicarbonate transport system substrate-binding protein
MKLNRRALITSLLASPFIAKAQNAPIKIGFVALTDAAPLIIAKEKGLFAKHGVNVGLRGAHYVII